MFILFFGLMCSPPPSVLQWKTGGGESLGVRLDCSLLCFSTHTLRDFVYVLALRCSKYMWQSRIEIKYYSFAYFECITEFDVL